MTIYKGRKLTIPADGSHEKLLNRLSKTRLLILDDWLLDGLFLTQTRDMLEIIDDRYKKGLTIFATQLPVSKWHSRFEDRNRSR
ncbi:MAG: hypothetical protein DRP37_08685 [Thermodesulfobacteriota bacterium]|nr:MAG: hypothetical protein DRP37_08685 [Thermodesulfobacteriota bacterium]